MALMRTDALLEEEDMPMADLSNTTVDRLRKHAVPLQDTFDTVIVRLIDFYEDQQVPELAKPGGPIKVSGDLMVFDHKDPPPLAFTTLTIVLLNDEQLAKADTFWNKVLNKVIIEASKLGHDANTIYKMLSVNSIVGERTDNGYAYLMEAGVSVQNQDSNAAFKQAFKLADELGMKLTVQFYWQDNEKAAYPLKRGFIEN